MFRVFKRGTHFLISCLIEYVKMMQQLVIKIEATAT